jgi:hypothetical protein
LKGLIFLTFLLSTTLFAKKDFFYSFIDSSGNQISEQRKEAINNGFDIIANVKKLSKEGNIDEAYAQIKDFKEKNKLKVLDSEIILLYADLSLKKKSKRFVIDAAKVLENAINSSEINEYDLSKAYMYLVDLKLATNKTKDAKYFAQIIIDSFDDELTKVYGKIYLAKVYKYQNINKKAIRTLYEVLTKTKDKLVATIVADELFDLYIKDKKYDEAKKLISQVLQNNIDYYANDSYLAVKKINNLIKVGMPEFAVDILKELLNRTQKDESIEDFKYKLASTYMIMYDRTNFYLEKAKELYKDILNDYPQGIFATRSKMFIDEILMRQGLLRTTVVHERYKDSESMNQKVLLQELLNDKSDKEYEKILRSKKIYRIISNKIAKRFGFDSMKSLFDEINIEMLVDMLNKGNCIELNKVLKISRKETLQKLIEDEIIKFKFFECLINVPYERAYLLAKESFNRSRDANLYLYLERMAFALDLNDEALEYSTKVEMVNNEEVLKKEFLYRYQILKAMNNSLGLDKFLFYAFRNKDLIQHNKDNPVIIDFYYDYYLYLTKKEEIPEAKKILEDLYNIQNSLKVYIYSPFVENELSRMQRDLNNLQGSLEYLLEAESKTRRVKPKDKVKMYYDTLKLYEDLGNTRKKQEYVEKCKSVNIGSDNLYKKMCDEM